MAKTIIREVGKSPLLPLGAGEVKYYDFSQNNSGGRWKVDENYGQNTIIAARNVKEANQRAEEVGIYFDGCNAGMDCKCCGDRWSSQWEESKDLEPCVYGEPIEKYIGKYYSTRDKVVVHHADGTRETFKVEAKPKTK